MSPQILDNALGAIGDTPLIRLDRIANLYGLKCNLLAKVEFTSAGGSVKDRIAKAMIEGAEKEGKLIPGKSVVIEPTSGNTGPNVHFALDAVLNTIDKGYSVIITLPNKMSLEKEATLRALGAEVVRTPTEAPWDAPESHIGVAQKLAREIPYAIILDQYANVNNPLAHEQTTGPEIIDAVVATPSTLARPSSGRVDVIVAGAGTGGTITGLSRAIKRHNKDCLVIGIDPQGSVLASGGAKTDDAGSYVVEGIGYDFVPDVLSPEDVHTWIKTTDKDAFAAVKLIMRNEGLLVGGSSGSALSGAFKWFETEEGKKVAGSSGNNVVVIFPDGVRNYMSKPWFLDIAMNSGPTPLTYTIHRILKGEDGSPAVAHHTSML